MRHWLKVRTPLVFTGTNSVGSDNAGTTVIYEKPFTLPPPIISITKPNSDPHTTSSSSEVIHADILNVLSASNVSAKFNGFPTTAFSYDPASKKFTYNANLVVVVQTF